MYFGLGTLQSFGQRYEQEKLVVGGAFRVCFAIVQPIAILVSLVYWLLLRDEAFNDIDPLFLRARSASQHAFNILFTLLDLFTTETKLKPIDCIYPLLFLGLYQVSSLVWFFVQGVWPYEFMAQIAGNSKENLKWDMIILFSGAIFVVTILFHFVVIGLIWVRDFVTTYTRRDTKEKGVDSSKLNAGD